jgi:hypothetical protein
LALDCVIGSHCGDSFYWIANYVDDLAKVMSKILCLCEIGALARDIQRQCDMIRIRHRSTLGHAIMSKENFEGLMKQADEWAEDSEKVVHDGAETTSPNERSSTPIGFLINPSDVDILTGFLSQSQRTKLNELLGAW